MMRFTFLITIYHYCIDQYQRMCGITTQDIAIFFRQFVTLLSANIPMIQSFDVLETTQEKTALRLFVNTIKQEILSGKNLTAALSSYPHFFDGLTLQLIKTGEQSGMLNETLSIAANHYEKKAAFKKQLKQALFYPTLIIIMALLMAISMLMFIIPHFADLFQNTAVKLPGITLFIFKLSTLLRFHTQLIFFTLLLLSILSHQGLRFNVLRQHLIQLLTTIPFIQGCFYKMTLIRFSRNLAITFKAGIPITDALKLTANASGNNDFINLIATLRTKISTGFQLHAAMTHVHYFPVMMIQMIKIGEESGTLVAMLDKIADLFEGEFDQRLALFNQLLEPLIMIVLGVLIGGLVIGIYLPIFKLGSAL